MPLEKLFVSRLYIIREDYAFHESAYNYSRRRLLRTSSARSSCLYYPAVPNNRKPQSFMHVSCYDFQYRPSIFPYARSDLIVCYMI